MSNPLFSVIIPTFNRKKLLREALESLSHQSFKNFELIVVDDGSTDDTIGLLARHPLDPIIIRQGNCGPAAARNAGIKVARGKYVVLFDSDDLWLPWTLETYASAISEFRDPALIIGSWQQCAVESPSSTPVSRGPNDFSFSADFLEASGRPVFWSSNNIAIRRDAFQGEYFDTSLRVYEDKDLGIRLGTRDGFVKIDAPVTVVYRRSESSLSGNVAEGGRGILAIVDKERRNEYPGGRERETQRIAYICMTGRSHCFALLRSSFFYEAWRLYAKTALWNLKLGRVRFCAGFPAIFLIRKLVNVRK